MLTYGLPNHNLPSHSNPRICTQKNCISSPHEVSFFRLYTYGSYSFLPRDILTLKENGFELDVDEDGKFITNVNPNLFPPMVSFFCDFYSGAERKKDEPLEKGSDLFRKIIIPPTDPIQIDQELELQTVQQKSGRRRDQESIKLLVQVRFLHVGMYYKNDVEYKSNPKAGLVEFVILRQDFSYSPITYIAPMRKRKKLFGENREDDLEETKQQKRNIFNR